MYKVVKRDCPMFGIGPYVCEFICDTASDITTLPTSISEGTGGKTAYDNQMCASGSIAIVAENGSESKQYMLNNQDIWCPYSVAAGSSGGGSSGSSVTVDVALSNTSENPVANKAITAALDDKANVDDIPNIKVNAAVNADTVGGLYSTSFVNYNEQITEMINNSNYRGAPYEGCISNGSIIGLPSDWWHIKYFRHVNDDGYGCQLAFSLNNDSIGPHYRTSTGVNWNEWKEIYTSGNKPYITGSATVAANTNACVSNHGFTPSAVIWWDGNGSGVAVSFNDTQFNINIASTGARTVNYLIFK